MVGERGDGEGGEGEPDQVVGMCMSPQTHMGLEGWSL